MNLLAKTIAGSRLYGLDNPSSDTDIKGIFLPSLRDCLLNKAPHTDSLKEPEIKREYEAFSLQSFVALASRAEDVAIVLLHAPQDKILHDSETYRFLRANRNRFYTKKMSGQMGLCVGMASKYALRADRMETVETVIRVLEGMIKVGVAKLSQVWDTLPELPHTTKGENPLDRNADKRVYTVVGKGLTAGITPAYALGIMGNVRDSYGARVKAAKNMDGQDLKAISHSFRVGYQLKHLFSDGTFSFPLPESPFIRAVKYGELNYVTDGLDAKLNDLISEVEELSAKSSFPEKVDQSWCDQFILDTYEREFGLNLTGDPMVS